MSRRLAQLVTIMLYAALLVFATVGDWIERQWRRDPPPPKTR